MKNERLEEERPWQDPIVAEVRRIREALFAEAGYDIHEFCRRLSEMEAASGHPVVNLSGGRTRDYPERLRSRSRLQRQPTAGPSGLIDLGDPRTPG